MTLKELFKVIKKEPSVIIEVHNKTGYETSYEFLIKELNRMNPKLANAIVSNISIWRGKLHISVDVKE